MAAVTRTARDSPGAAQPPGQVPRPGRAEAGRALLRSAAAFAALAAVTAHAQNGRLWPLDQAVIRAVQARRRPAAVSAAHALSALAEPAFASAVLAACTVLAARRAGWRAACLPGLTVASGAVARRRLSQLIARPRPPAAAWLAEPEGFSLPSKHTTLAALTAGACASSAGARGAPRLLVPLMAAAGAGTSRVLLGVHWPTDVLAAWLFAEGWLGLAEAAAPAPGRARAPGRAQAFGRARAVRPDQESATREEALPMDAHDGIELRCSAIVVRQQAVLLIHRTYDGADDWVLPGGTPRPGESTAACARREVREETGLWVDPARVAFVLEVVGPEAGPRTLDIVFAATEAGPGARPESREPGMEPLFVPAGRLGELDLRPPLAGHLRGLLGHGRERYAPYLANLWRPDGRAPGPGEPAVAPEEWEQAR